MKEPSIHDILSKTFSSSGKKEWLKQVSQELPDKNPVEKLTWQIDGIKFYPYYAESDLVEIANEKKFYSSFVRARAGWLNAPEVNVTNEQSANRKALQHLASGADAILFDISQEKPFDVNKLLENIQWNYCPLYFILPDSKIATKIFEHAAQRQYDLSKLTGCFFWRSFPRSRELQEIAAFPLKNYFRLGIMVPPLSPVREISASLHQAVEIMDTLTDMGMDRETIFRTVSLSIVCDENFLVTVAKLKSLRALWYQLSQSFGIDGYSPADLHIHCRTRNEIAEKFQPRGNMIKNTIQAVSAILGSCDALTLPSTEFENGMADRIALNVSNILREESRLDKVADPLNGSYAVENMVHALSQAAWKDFQNNLQA